MPLTGTRTFVGFGFGAIQSGLFLYEAHHSGQFRRLVVAEVVPDVVGAVRRDGGHYQVGIPAAASWGEYEFIAGVALARLRSMTRPRKLTA